MKFRESIGKIIDAVGNATGLPVEVTEDVNLSVRATVASARPGFPFHLIRTNPRHGEVDYVVAFQCGFVLRQAALLPEERWVFGPSAKAVPAVGRMIAAPGGVAAKIGLPPQAASQLANQLASGLLTQLRSMPIGTRIDTWIRQDYADLSDLQTASIRSQVIENAQALSPQVKRMTPVQIWKSSTSMSAAYASFGATLTGDRSLTLAYDATGSLSSAKPLLDVLGALPEGPDHDKQLVNEWGKILGVSDWYEFLSAQPKEEPS